MSAEVLYRALVEHDGSGGRMGWLRAACAAGASPWRVVPSSGGHEWLESVADGVVLVASDDNGGLPSGPGEMLVVAAYAASDADAMREGDCVDALWVWSVSVSDEDGE